MVHVDFEFINGFPISGNSDPQQEPVIIIGKAKNIRKLRFDQIEHRLHPRVNSDTFEAAVASFSPNPTDSVSLYLNNAFLCALPNKYSMDNAPSRPHALTKLVKGCSNSSGCPVERVIIVCPKEDVFASGCAVVRAYPTYSRKTNEISRAKTISANAEGGHDEMMGAEKVFVHNSKVSGKNIIVEFIVINEENDSIELSVAAGDLKALKDNSVGIQLAARIVDMPCNEMNTDAFVAVVEEIGAELNCQVNVVRGEDLKKRGFGGIYGVGKAALHPPAMAVLSHTPQGATKTVAWVGKGIVYDTGGLSIKGKTAMPGMKRDCGGAAGILGAFYAAVKQNFNQNLHAVFCLAENAVGDRATRPDDIHTLYSGRTVEINNTDAEGRLVVGDGVAYARKDLEADMVVDMCTLTGAQGTSTGRYHAAHLTNRREWSQFCAEAGRSSGDLSFPLVYCPELHFAEFNSAVADMKNSVAVSCFLLLIMLLSITPIIHLGPRKRSIFLRRIIHRGSFGLRLQRRLVAHRHGISCSRRRTRHGLRGRSPQHFIRQIH